VYLHNNLIATIDKHSVEIYDGGWQSNTTKSRLNAIINGLCDGMNQGVYQHKFEWFIQDDEVGAKFTIPFDNGYTFKRVWERVKRVHTMYNKLYDNRNMWYNALNDVHENKLPHNYFYAYLSCINEFNDDD